MSQGPRSKYSRRVDSSSDEGMQNTKVIHDGEPAVAALDGNGSQFASASNLTTFLLMLYVAFPRRTVTIPFL